MKKTDKKLALGVVGVGHMGKYHVNVLSQIRTIDFVGIYDKDENLREKIAQDYQVKAFSSLKEIIANVDALIVAVPTSLHYETAQEVIKAQKHVLVEKPLCNNLEQAKHLVALAEENNVKLLVGHVERYNAAVQELEKLITTPPILWESKRIGTYNKRPSDIGVALDLLIHDIDIAIKTLKSPIVDFTAMGEKIYSDFEDILIVQARFANNSLARFLVSRAHHQKDRILKISQKSSDIVLDFVTQDINIYKDAASNITTNPESIMYKQQASIERVFIHKENPLKLEILDFIDSIIEDKKIDNQSDLLTLETIFKILEQIKK